MKKTMFVGFAAAGLLAGTSAVQAQQTTPQSDYPTTSPAKAQPSTAGETGRAGSPASQATQVSGVLKSLDEDKRSLTIAPSTGAQQDIKVADSAAITRDGASVGLDQLKAGDHVRASFDPATNQATTLEVHSKQMK